MKLKLTRTHVFSKLMTKNMREDLEFYIKHDSEMYFKGMVVIAVAWIGILITGVVVVLTGNIIGVIMAILGAHGFSAVKMYLHVRKDAIEIKEMMKK